MSHFSTIKTKLKSTEHLLEALDVLGHDPEQEQQVMVVSDREHAKGHPNVKVDFVAANKTIGFRWNESSQSYELVTDLQTWNQPIPVERFLSKLSQQYALKNIEASDKDEGFTITDKVVAADGSIEVVCSRWE